MLCQLIDRPGKAKNVQAAETIAPDKDEMMAPVAVARFQWKAASVGTKVAGTIILNVHRVRDSILAPWVAKIRPTIPIPALKSLIRFMLTLVLGQTPLTSNVAATSWYMTTAMALPASSATNTSPLRPGPNVAAKVVMASLGLILGKLALALRPTKAAINPRTIIRRPATPRPILAVRMFLVEKTS